MFGTQVALRLALGGCIVLALCSPYEASAASYGAPDPGPITPPGPLASAERLEGVHAAPTAPRLSHAPTGSPARSLAPPKPKTDDLARLQSELRLASGGVQLFTAPELESLLPGAVELRLSASDHAAISALLEAGDRRRGPPRRLRATMVADGYSREPGEAISRELTRDGAPLTFGWRLSPAADVAEGKRRPGPIRVSLGLEAPSSEARPTPIGATTGELVFLVLERAPPDLAGSPRRSAPHPGWMIGAFALALGLLAGATGWVVRARRRSRP